MRTYDFMNLIKTVVPARELQRSLFEGPIPAPCDAAISQLWSTFRDLQPTQRCEIEKMVRLEQRAWLHSESDRLAMLSIRQHSRTYLEDALCGIFIGYPGEHADLLDRIGFGAGVAIGIRCARLLGLEPAVIFEEQLRYFCDEEMRKSVRGIVALSPELQQLQSWDFREEIGDHGIIFRWGRLPVPEAWL